MVIVHDELELALGKVRVKEGGSAKGHNGLRSVIQSMGGAGGWWRLGVGIGRPESRDSGAVSDFVLRKIKPVERERIVGCVEEVEMLTARLEGDG